MEIDRHTPRLHVTHEYTCGCSLQRDTDYFICECGAAYTDEVLKFAFWRCYDCGRYRLSGTNIYNIRSNG